MTLLLSCATRSYIVELSDRRLTMPDGSLVDENANKAICFNGETLISYTGIAHIGALRTDEWITEVLLREPHLDRGIPALQKKLSAEVHRLRVKNGSLIVRMTGWRLKGRLLLPRTILIANCIDREKNVRSEPEREFSVFTRDFPISQRMQMSPLGQLVYPSIQKKFKRSVARLSQRQPLGALPSAKAIERLMRETVLEVAAGNKAVGENLMACTLYNPRVPENAGRKPEFYYHSQDKSVVYFPIAIWPGVAMKNIELKVDE